MAGAARQCALAVLLGITIGIATPSDAASPERRSFVVSWFYPAIYTQPDNCPSGINPLSTGIMQNALSLAGKTSQETESILESVAVGGGGANNRKARDAIVDRGKAEGKSVNAYLNPTTAPDPGFKTAVGKFAYGFDLDGKGAADSNAFEDPETHQKGVDNAYFRVVGCVENHQAPPGHDPVYPISTWDTLRDTMPAWVVTIEGKDLSRDGDVKIVVDRAINTVIRDAHGEILVDQTFEVDPDQRSHNVISGTIKNGLLSAKAPKFFLLGDEFLGYELDFTRIQLRLNLKPDGAAEGILGGYVKWMPLYVQHAGAGLTAESMRGVDIVGFYRAYSKLADADADPTGQNTRVSSAWRLKLLPAFVLPRETKR